ncbi:unnamed protein product [Toxocara canis]|uniref:DUF5069 domain-containing protein n=1 Tax=Toxocara canis TaxID=6265 RepID=A0A183TW06_TOXCA|nr:unnamed protein product [Toxocara canis]
MHFQQHCSDCERSITRNFNGYGGSVRFNAGSIAGSTDMLNLIRLYQESDDKDTVEHWMDIFTQNKLKQAAQNVASHFYENGYLQANGSDLYEYSRSRSSPDALKTKLSLIRSMDPLPPKKDSQGNLLG